MAVAGVEVEVGQRLVTAKGRQRLDAEQQRSAEGGRRPFDGCDALCQVGGGIKLGRFDGEAVVVGHSLQGGNGAGGIALNAVGQDRDDHIGKLLTGSKGRHE